MSHHSDDTGAARELADYIQTAGVDVYFDEDDEALKLAVERNDADQVTAAIRKGLALSDYMLCAISPSTVKSYWVPFEVGYAYSRIQQLAIVRLRGVSRHELPDYMRATGILNGIEGLNQLLASILNSQQTILESRGVITKSSASAHPLRNVLASG